MSALEKRFLANLTVPSSAISIFADAIEPFVTSLTMFEATPDGESWSIQAVLGFDYNQQGLDIAISLAAAATGIAQPNLAIEPLRDVDWLAQVRADFPPFQLGRFYLHGSHHVPRPGNGPFRLLIDAGTAFGSGEHPTTRGCIAGLEMLAKRHAVKRVLDMGCGSGILALAAARLWHCPVTAVDIDDEAVRVTMENARINGAARLIRAGAGDGYRAPILSRAQPFDVIVSNILARPLRRMAPRLARCLKPGGYAILSGLLKQQETSVLAAHRAQGLHLVARRPIGEWMTLVLGK